MKKLILVAFLTLLNSLVLAETSNGKNIEQYGTTSYHSHKQHQQNIYIKVEQLL